MVVKRNAKEAVVEMRKAVCDARDEANDAAHQAVRVEATDEQLQFARAQAIFPKRKQSTTSSRQRSRLRLLNARRLSRFGRRPRGNSPEKEPCQDPYGRAAARGGWY